MKKTLSVRGIIAGLLMFVLLAATTACGGGSYSDDAEELSFIVGTWNEVSIAPQTLTVNSDGTYTLTDSAGDTENGKVRVTYEEHSDGSKCIWYDFFRDTGKLWSSFSKNEETKIQNDIYFGQDNAMHFIRDGIDEKITADDYLHVWSNGRCIITVEKNKNTYIVTISWSSSAFHNTIWTYECYFDKKTSSLVCKNGATCVDFTVSESGKETAKTLYKDGSGSFLIKNGTLRWTDDMENQGADNYFVNIDEAVGDTGEIR